MRGKIVSITDPKTHLDRRIVRVERGKRARIAFAGRPVAELRPARKPKKHFSPLDDPLFRVDEYSYDGPIGLTTNRDIDSIVCAV